MSGGASVTSDVKTDPGFWFHIIWSDRTSTDYHVLMFPCAAGHFRPDRTVHPLDDFYVAGEPIRLPVTSWCFIGSETETSPWVGEYPLPLQLALYECARRRMWARDWVMNRKVPGV